MARHRRYLIPTSVLRGAGQSLMALGVLVLLFAGFELWGTGFLQHRAQDSIKSEVTKYLPKPTNGLPVGPATPFANTTPPVEGSWVGMISIPAIHLSQVIVQGTSVDDLRLGPGHYLGTPLPGEAGNVSIAGHRTTWAEPFRHLDQLHFGDPIIINTPRGEVLYRIYNIFVVKPSNVSVIAPSSDNILTLTTCNPPYSAATRLVVKARLAAVQASGSQVTTPGTTVIVTQNVLSVADGGRGWWPVFLYGELLLIILLFGRRWLLRSAYKPAVSVGLVVVTIPVLFELFNGIAWLLPAGY